MSAIASLHVLKIGDLPEVVGAAGSGRAGEVIRRLGRVPAREYGWSGYVMMNVLDSLDERGVGLESADLHESSEALNAAGYTVLITGDAAAFSDRLDPGAYEPGDLVAGPIELGFDDAEARDATAETLTLLRETIEGLAADDVLLVRIG